MLDLTFSPLNMTKHIYVNRRLICLLSSYARFAIVFPHVYLLICEQK